MHGAFVMGHEQLICHGNADCWNSSYGERMHQSFFTRLGRQTQRRFSSLAAQVGDRRAEAYTTERAVNDIHKFLMPHNSKDCEDDVDDENTVGLETTNWNYHDNDIPLVNDAVGSGKYNATLLLTQTGEVCASVNWSDNDKQVLKKKLGYEFIYAINAYARSKGWTKSVNISGYTSIRKPDLTQNCEVTYRSNSDFRGREWIDWAFIHFEDSSKGDDEVNIGRLLGFFHFEDRGFPTPRNCEKDFVEDVFDRTMYIVVRCCGKYKNFDEKFVKLQFAFDNFRLYFSNSFTNFSENSTLEKIREITTEDNLE